MKTFAVATPLLLSMVSRAAHLDPQGLPTIVMEIIDGQNLMCVGRRVQRNGLDGHQPTVMVRWRINGAPATRRQVYERFGERVTT